MQSPMFSNRFIIGIVAFGVSFGLTLVLKWNFGEAFLTAIITVPATYLAVFFVDKRRRNYEMLILDSLYKRIRELEGLKSHCLSEVSQLENHRNSLYNESNQLQNQVTDRRNQRDILNRELSSFVGQKMQLEAVLNQLRNEVDNLEKSKIEAHNSLLAEKRRQELNINVTRVEITKLQIHVNELKRQQEEIENNLTLLERLKPQLEEKLHELRVNIQELETQENQKNELLLAKITEQKSIENKIKSVQAKITARQEEFRHIEAQISLLKDERGLLQTQVWELLQQLENLNQEPLNNNIPDSTSDEAESFPFSELLETLEPKKVQVNTIENLPPYWVDFFNQLPDSEFQVLKAILKENPQAIIKQIAEANITMPNLLIDAINERANDTIGELIIQTNTETPVIYPEHIAYVKKIVETYEEIIAQRAASN
jgi:peptidoglycan hydrolase CwlO-like protein